MIIFKKIQIVIAAIYKLVLNSTKNNKKFIKHYYYCGMSTRRSIHFLQNKYYQLLIVVV